jgi:hypothetical protein
MKEGNHNIFKSLIENSIEFILVEMYWNDYKSRIYKTRWSAFTGKGRAVHPSQKIINLGCAPHLPY